MTILGLDSSYQKLLIPSGENPMEKMTRIKFTLVELEYLRACIRFTEDFRKQFSPPVASEKNDFAHTAVWQGIERLSR